MRVTNQMITRGSLRNMQGAMQRVSKLNQQATTHKKISTPSEDPVVAIRALKLRTTVDQLSQFKNKNVQDALSWVGTTQTSVENVFDRLKDVYGYCEQGATDTFQTKDRYTIVEELKELKDAIYREGSMTYAGRYLFSGYKTETNLVFQDQASKEGLSYDIHEEFSPSTITTKRVVKDSIDGASVTDIVNYPDEHSYTAPTADSVYRLRLSYSNLDTDGLSITVVTSDGTENTTIPVTVKEMADTDTYYEVDENGINYIPETGELIFGNQVYENTIRKADNIKLDYKKSEFAVGDLRPEMYFNCTQHKVLSDGSTTNTEFTVDEAGQEIQYEVNFNQYITVNAQGKDFILHDMGNRIEDLTNAVQDVIQVEDTKTKLENMLNSPEYNSDAEKVERINTILKDIDVELAIKKEQMQITFGNNMTAFQNFMETVSSIQAKVGTTYSKLELIEERVTEQLANFKELKSSNEDIDTEETAIELYQAELVYDAALATTSSVIKKTLLDYL